MTVMVAEAVERNQKASDEGVMKLFVIGRLAA
jgi:hypothetical protein